MADSGVDTSNESSDNPVFSRAMLEFEPPAIPLPPVPSLPLVPVELAPSEPHDYVGKMKSHHSRRRRVEPDHTSRNQRLRTAASTNNAELVEKLLAGGADPNASDAHQRSPLHLAACRGYVEVVRALLRSGADPNARDLRGNTPLHLAACTSHVPVVTELLDAGTDVASHDKHGRTPLQLAQSKLRLMRQWPSAGHAHETKALVAEVCLVVEMMLKYLKVRAADGAELESVIARLERVTTREQVDSEVQCLLDSLDSLKLR